MSICSYKTISVFLGCRWGVDWVFLCRWVGGSGEQMGEPQLGLIVALVNNENMPHRFLMTVSFTSSMPVA